MFSSVVSFVTGTPDQEETISSMISTGTSGFSLLFLYSSFLSSKDSLIEDSSSLSLAAFS